ncbi:MAG: ABC transporter permease [Nitriliruptorales bacterium]
MSAPDLPAPAVPRATARRTLVAVGNEVGKGLLHGWAERKQIVLELVMFVAIFLLFAALLGQGEAIADGRFEWSFDPLRTAWLFVGFAAFQFHYLQTQKLFWRLLGEIQTGTLDQVFLSPLPSWVVAAAGRVVASAAETVLVVTALYAGTRLAVPIDLAWHPDALLAGASFVAASVGYSLAIGGLTLRFKRIEILSDGLHILVLFLAGAMVPLSQIPGWMAAVGRFLPITHPIAALRTTLLDGSGLHLTGDGGIVWLAATAAGWLALGAVAFHRGDVSARRDGTLTRY